jgi:sugar phosphate isomerase/epimerase
MAKAMGAPALTMSTRVSLTPQIDALAKKHKMRVGIHNHSRIQPDQLATAESFAEALKGRSEYMMINFDIGHFAAANFDVLAFVRENHSRIMSMHVKDRKKDQGPPVPLGTGDTPVAELLRVVRDRKWNIPGYIEHEYKAEDSAAEVRKAFEYCKRVLQS